MLTRAALSTGGRAKSNALSVLRPQEYFGLILGLIFLRFPAKRPRLEKTRASEREPRRKLREGHSVGVMVAVRSFGLRRLKVWQKPA
jgi:hypothetical protein